MHRYDVLGGREERHNKTALATSNGEHAKTQEEGT
jgi:hypothetical protein